MIRLNTKSLSLLICISCISLSYSCSARRFTKSEKTVAPEARTPWYFPQMLTAGADSNFSYNSSPNGQYLFFSSERTGNKDIYEKRTQGGAPRQITFHTADDYSPSMSPDGRMLALISKRDDAPGDIYIMDMGFTFFSFRSETEKPLRRLSLPGSEESNPQWFPDNTRILFSSRESGKSSSRIFVMDPHKMSVLEELPIIGDHARVTSDGKTIIFNQKSKIHTYNLETKESNQITFGKAIDHSPVASSDLKWLYFVRYSHDTNRDSKTNHWDNSSIWRQPFFQHQSFETCKGTDFCAEPVTSSQYSTLDPILRANSIIFLKQQTNRSEISSLPDFGHFENELDSISWEDGKRIVLNRESDQDRLYILEKLRARAFRSKDLKSFQELSEDVARFSIQLDMHIAGSGTSINQISPPMGALLSTIENRNLQSPQKNISLLSQILDLEPLNAEVQCITSFRLAEELYNSASYERALHHFIKSLDCANLYQSQTIKTLDFLSKMRKIGALGTIDHPWAGSALDIFDNKDSGTKKLSLLINARTASEGSENNFLSMPYAIRLMNLQSYFRNLDPSETPKFLEDLSELSSQTGSWPTFAQQTIKDTRRKSILNFVTYLNEENQSEISDKVIETALSDYPDDLNLGRLFIDSEFKKNRGPAIIDKYHKRYLSRTTSAENLYLWAYALSKKALIESSLTETSLQIDECIKLIEESVQKNSQVASFHLSLGWLYLQKYRIDKKLASKGGLGRKVHQRWKILTAFFGFPTEDPLLSSIEASLSARSMSTEPVDQAAADHNLGNAHYFLGQYQKALFHYAHRIEASSQIKIRESDGVLQLYTRAARSAFQSEEYALAVKLQEHALNAATIGLIDRDKESYARVKEQVKSSLSLYAHASGNKKYAKKILLELEAEYAESSELETRIRRNIMASLIEIADSELLQAEKRLHQTLPLIDSNQGTERGKKTENTEIALPNSSSRGKGFSPADQKILIHQLLSSISETQGDYLEARKNLEAKIEALNVKISSKKPSGSEAQSFQEELSIAKSEVARIAFNAANPKVASDVYKEAYDSIVSAKPKDAIGPTGSEEIMKRNRFLSALLDQIENPESEPITWEGLPEKYLQSLKTPMINPIMAEKIRFPKPSEPSTSSHRDIRTSLLEKKESVWKTYAMSGLGKLCLKSFHENHRKSRSLALKKVPPLDLISLERCRLSSIKMDTDPHEFIRSIALYQSAIGSIKLSDLPTWEQLRQKMIPGHWVAIVSSGEQNLLNVLLYSKENEYLSKRITAEGLDDFLLEMSKKHQIFRVAIVVDRPSSKIDFTTALTKSGKNISFETFSDLVTVNHTGSAFYTKSSFESHAELPFSFATPLDLAIERKNQGIVAIKIGAIHIGPKNTIDTVKNQDGTVALQEAFIDLSENISKSDKMINPQLLRNNWLMLNEIAEAIGNPLNDIQLLKSLPPHSDLTDQPQDSLLLGQGLVIDSDIQKKCTLRIKKISSLVSTLPIYTQDFLHLAIETFASCPGLEKEAKEISGQLTTKLYGPWAKEQAADLAILSSLLEKPGMIRSQEELLSLLSTMESSSLYSLELRALVYSLATAAELTPFDFSQLSSPLRLCKILDASTTSEELFVRCSRLYNRPTEQKVSLPELPEAQSSIESWIQEKGWASALSQRKINRALSLLKDEQYAKVITTIGDLTAIHPDQLSYAQEVLGNAYAKQGNALEAFKAATRSSGASNSEEANVPPSEPFLAILPSLTDVLIFHFTDNNSLKVSAFSDQKRYLDQLYRSLQRQDTTNAQREILQKVENDSIFGSLGEQKIDLKNLRFLVTSKEWIDVPWEEVFQGMQKSNDTPSPFIRISTIDQKLFTLSSTPLCWRAPQNKKLLKEFDLYMDMLTKRFPKMANNQCQQDPLSPIALEIDSPSWVSVKDHTIGLKKLFKKSSSLRTIPDSKSPLRLYARLGSKPH